MGFCGLMFIVVIVVVVITLPVVKNIESVVTQRCWSPRKMRITK